MIKKFIFTIFLGILLVYPINTNAANVSVNLKCPTVVTSGQTITCDVEVTSDVTVTGLSAKYTLDNLTYVSFTPDNGFSDYAPSNKGFAIGNLTGKTGTFSAGKISLVANGTGSITLRSLDASDSNNNAYSPADKTVSIRAKSNNTALGGLSLSTGTLSPAFSKDITNYTATVDAASVTINATKGDEYQTITGTGTKQLNYGPNVFEINVTSEVATTQKYTITITRPDNRSTVNTLKTLTLSSGTISFSANTKTYNVEVETDKIKITSSLTDAKSKYVEGFGDREVSLNYGVNTILIKVQSEKGDINTYTLNVTRKDTRSTVNTLKTLAVSNGILSYKENTKTYNITVKSDITKMKVTSTLTDAKSKYVEGFGNREVSLNYGVNQILVKVQSEKGDVNTYTINVTREDNRSDVNTLKTLQADNITINFTPDTKKYEATVKTDIDKIKITSTLTDAKSKYVEGFGNREVKLSYGVNTILVKVQSEKGNINTYTLVITREIEEDLKPKDTTISKITVNGKEISNVQDTFEVEIEEGQTLDLSLLLTNAKATYVVEGNENLQDGSIVTIKVTSEDKTENKEYKINVKVKEKEDIPSEGNDQEEPGIEQPKDEEDNEPDKEINDNNTNNEEKEENSPVLTIAAVGILVLGLSVFGYALFKKFKK